MNNDIFDLLVYGAMIPTISAYHYDYPAYITNLIQTIIETIRCYDISGCSKYTKYPGDIKKDIEQFEKDAQFYYGNIFELVRNYGEYPNIGLLSHVIESILIKILFSYKKYVLGKFCCTKQEMAKLLKNLFNAIFRKVLNAHDEINGSFDLLKINVNGILLESNLASYSSNVNYSDYAEALAYLVLGQNGNVIGNLDTWALTVVNLLNKFVREFECCQISKQKSSCSSSMSCGLCKNKYKYNSHCNCGCSDNDD